MQNSTCSTRTFTILYLFETAILLYCGLFDVSEVKLTTAHDYDLINYVCMIVAFYLLQLPFFMIFYSVAIAVVLVLRAYP